MEGPIVVRRLYQIGSKLDQLLQTYGYQKGKGVGEGINEEYGINRYTLLSVK